MRNLLFDDNILSSSLFFFFLHKVLMNMQKRILGILMKMVSISRCILELVTSAKYTNGPKN